MARGLRMATQSSSHQVSVANIPKTANGTKLSKPRTSAKITVVYTLILTIFRITKAPRSCRITAPMSSFFPMGSLNRTIT